MLITVQNLENDGIVSIEVEESMTVEDMKALIEVETGISLQE